MIDSPVVDSPNSSLLQDELLFQLVQTLDDVYPLGPSFLHALSTVLEAAVLHDVNYFDPLADFTEGTGLQSRVQKSQFIQDLVAGGALCPLPASQDIDLCLGQLEVDYKMIDLVQDVAWTTGGTAFNSVESEAKYFRSLAELVEGYSGIFGSKDLTDDDDHATVPDAERLLDIGMPIENLIHIEGQNHRLAGLLRFSQVLRLNLYTNQASIPNQIGMVRRANSVARVLYEKLRSELGPLDEDDIGGDDFATIEMPELTRIVLRNSKGDIRAIAPEILSLRQRHAALRRYLTDYDEAWRTAASNRQRMKLQDEFNNAWEALIKSERKPKDRLIYKVWGVFRNPTQIAAALGDELVKVGRHWAVTGQVRGLHAFWADMLDAPVARENFQLASSLRVGVASLDVWQSHRALSSALKEFVARA